ncbi:hypothetical protein [Bradyrhizobium sp. BWA-3-5]|uniref:hypothetical protein n=1 Tax=Bradyrhizobium sp. BWA-3-5 TaxID=3080013 RepID=UPI00293E08FC|nr:hypothetical protein [Bradyrhizobium sp. BWA-3-5]WOH63810.1 hypothetical protein RX331_24305 [Bradyrhizobium sp. BWA-3-5]
MKLHDQRLAAILADFGAGKNRSSQLHKPELSQSSGLQSRMSPESVPECLPIGDEIVDVQQFVIGPLCLRQSSNQRPRGLQHKDAAIITIPLLSHVGLL